MPSFPRFPAPLPGDGVQLRLAAERDIPEILIAHQDDPQLYGHLGMQRPPSGAELGRRSELADTERALGARLWLTILAPGSDECRGQIDVHEAELHYGRTDLSIWVASQHRDQGLGSAALALAGRWLIGEAGLKRVQLFIEPGNGPMLTAAAKAGFVREGVLRGYWRARAGREPSGREPRGRELRGRELRGRQRSGRERTAREPTGRERSGRRDAEAWSLVTPGLETVPPS